VVGSVAEVDRLPIDPKTPVAYVTQTTLSVDDTRDIIAALKRRFRSLVGPELDDICYATSNRQDAVRTLSAQVDLVLVIGAKNSSNSQRLREVAAQSGVSAYLVPDATAIDERWLVSARNVGITAGASAPERLVTEVCDRLRTLGARTVREVEGPREQVVFKLPPPFSGRAVAHRKS
jgi:4-hydroxy-3-methylbut-2-enyl diphosphate reductase